MTRFTADLTCFLSPPLPSIPCVGYVFCVSHVISPRLLPQQTFSHVEGSTCEFFFPRLTVDHLLPTQSIVGAPPTGAID